MDNVADTNTLCLTPESLPNGLALPLLSPSSILSSTDHSGGEGMLGRYCSCWDILSCLYKCLTFLWKVFKGKVHLQIMPGSETLGLTSWENEAEPCKTNRCIINVSCVENSFVSRMQTRLMKCRCICGILCCFLGCFHGEHFDIYFGDITHVFHLLEFSGTAYFVESLLNYIHWNLV